ncbi:MAG: hypothetical protein Q9N62_02310 [Ghiorsea sp.]|nr:hypothetical protein [Ghiorsea sp.]
MRGSMSCWTQFCTILHGQLSSKQTLREIPAYRGASQEFTYIIILEPSKAARSTLSDANRERPSAIYLELFYWLLNQLREATISCKKMLFG